MALFARLVRSYRRITAQLLAPQVCVICLDALPALKLSDATRDASPVRAQTATTGPERRADAGTDRRRDTGNGNDGEPTFAKLACKHKFCTDCIRQYISMKIHAKEVDDDQLVCPELACKRPIAERDIHIVCGDAALQQFQKALHRKRNERNPSARWCPRPGCDELIVCDSTGDFTCPACATVGCFRCRALAHGPETVCDEPKDEADVLYAEWEKALGGRGAGDRRAVRPCPQCQMRIWKADGCVHMTCSHCRFEFCWVCAATWEPSHYSCTGPSSFDSDLVLGLCLLAVIAIAIAWFLKAYAFSNQQIFTILCGAFGALCVYGQDDNGAPAAEANIHETAAGRLLAGALVGAVVGVGICVLAELAIVMLWFAWSVVKFMFVVAVGLLAMGVVKCFTQPGTLERPLARDT